MLKPSLWHAARTVKEKGLADALIVSGAMTGEETSVDEVRVVKSAVRDTPVLVGSGVDESNVANLVAVADGAIVGTSLKRDGQVINPVDRQRVRRIVDLAASACDSDSNIS